MLKLIVKHVQYYIVIFVLYICVDDEMGGLGGFDGEVPDFGDGEGGFGEGEVPDFGGEVPDFGDLEAGDVPDFGAAQAS